MAVPADLLEIIIDYLYTDNIPNKCKRLSIASSPVVSIESRLLVPVEQLCQILVLSDQLLIERLKQICEFHITNLSKTSLWEARDE